MPETTERYSIAPQMRDYDRLGVEWLPYLMHFHPPNFRSCAVNTDTCGFRFSHKNGNLVRTFGRDDQPAVNLIVGGSASFGIGASSDGDTISSVLNSRTDEVWLNFGGRAFSSTQELLLFLLYHRLLGMVRRIVIVSGVNSLSMMHLSDGYTRDVGPFFYWNRYCSAMRQSRGRPRSWKLKLQEVLRWAGLRQSRRDGAAVCGNHAEASVGQVVDLGQTSLSLDKVSVNLESLEDKKADLLRVLDRDLGTWRLLADAMGIKLYYILQPLANWIERQVSVEEKNLFSILDGLKDNAWNVLRDHMGREEYVWFAAHVSRICGSHGIPFRDLNQELGDSRLSGRWLFVDRVHLTDEGYRVAAEVIGEEVQDC